jgi:membrane protein DedA with SNARE-associated domain
VIEFFSSLVDAVTEAPPIWRNLIAGFAIMLETSIFLGLVMPGDTVVILASTMVLDWGDFAFLLMAVLIGSLIGETIGFFIGRFFGPKLRHSKLGRKVGEKNWVLADKLVAKRGGVAVFISRFLPVLHSVVPAVAGMTKMPYKVFISWTFAACTIWASMYVGVGYLARASFDQLSENLRVASFVGIGIILLFMLLVFIGKKLLNNYAHKEV